MQNLLKSCLLYFTAAIDREELAMRKATELAAAEEEAQRHEQAMAWARSPIWRKCIRCGNEHALRLYIARDNETKVCGDCLLKELP